MFVLAGTHSQFYNFCHLVGLNPYETVYVFSEEQLRGRPRGLFLVRVGTWRIGHETSMLRRIHELAKHMGWQVEDWNESEDPLRLRARACRSASSRSAT